MSLNPKIVESDNAYIKQVDDDPNMAFWVVCPEGEGWGISKEDFDEMIQDYFTKHF